MNQSSNPILRRKLESNLQQTLRPLSPTSTRPGAPFAGLLRGGLMHQQLDAIDWKILAELQRNGRITNVELARRVGISAPPCLRRMRALEEAGFIKGYRGLLDQKLLGYEITGFAMVHLASQAEPDLLAFENFVKA